MSKSNPVGRDGINPMSVTEYENRKAKLMGVAPIAPKNKSFKETFISKMYPPNASNRLNDFRSDTFYHFNLKAKEEDIVYTALDINFTRIPFTRIAIVCDYTHLDGEVQKVVVKYNHTKEDTIELSLYYYFPKDDKWCPVVVANYNPSIDKVIWLPEGMNGRRINDPAYGEELRIFFATLLYTLCNFYDAYEKFEPVSRNVIVSKPLQAVLDKMPAASEYYREYVLDMNKPRSNSTKANDIKGTHARPCEHIRRPHRRRLRNGEVRWFGETTVNKGVGKTTKKEYKL